MEIHKILVDKNKITSKIVYSIYGWIDSGLSINLLRFCSSMMIFPI